MEKALQTFDNWAILHQKRLKTVIFQIYHKIRKYNVANEQYVENICLFTLWKMFLKIQEGKLQDNEIEPLLYTYCYNTIRTLLQKEKLIKADASPHQSIKHLPIECAAYKSDNTNILQIVSNKELLHIAINNADKYEMPYIYAVFFDGMTIVDTAKKFKVHHKTVSYHLTKYYRKMKIQYDRTTK